ncbi:MAG: hypothetical protein ACREDH_15940, partial [Methylocella sp.]
RPAKPSRNAERRVSPDEVCEMNLATKVALQAKCWARTNAPLPVPQVGRTRVAANAAAFMAI